MIVPKEWTAVAAYICGWANFLGNAAGDATFAWSWTQFLSACITLDGGNLSVGAQVAISIAILLFWTLLNCADVANIGWINNLAAFTQVHGWLIVFPFCESRLFFLLLLFF